MNMDKSKKQKSKKTEQVDTSTVVMPNMSEMTRFMRLSKEIFVYESIYPIVGDTDEQILMYLRDRY